VNTAGWMRRNRGCGSHLLLVHKIEAGRARLSRMKNAAGDGDNASSLKV